MGRLDQFEKYYKDVIKPELEKREERVSKELDEIPALMTEITEHLEELLKNAKDKFSKNVHDSIENEKQKIQRLKAESLPQRLNFLRQTYS